MKSYLSRLKNVVSTLFKGKDLNDVMSGIKDYKELIDGLIAHEVDGVLIFRNGNKYVGKGILIVEDLAKTIDDSNPYDVMNMLKSYFNSLNLGFPIEYRLFIRPLNKGKVINALDRRLQNLLIIAETDPSNSKVRSEIERLKLIKNRILKEGYVPFEVIIFYAIEYSSGNVDDVVTVVKNRVNVLKNVLESQGIRCKFLNEVGPILKRKVLHMFFRGLANSRVNYVLPSFIKGFKVLSLNIFPLSPIAIRRRPKNTLFSEGIYLGVDLRSSNYVFWNLINSLNPHIMVIGPSGVGKTEFLTVIGLRTWLTYGFKVIFIDLRGEFKERLRTRGIYYNLINVEEYGLNILKPFCVTPRARASQLADIISYSYNLDYDLSAYLYRALVNTYALRGFELSKVYEMSDLLNISWDDVINNVEYSNYPYASTLLRVIDEVKNIDLVSTEHILSKVVDGINVIDLSSLRGKEEIIRVALLTLMSDSLNLASLTTSSDIKFVVIVDEFWYLTNTGRVNPLPLTLLKLGRGYGVAFFTATQSFEDLKPNTKQFVDNTGLLVIMNSPSLTYWKEVSKYVVLSDEEINELRTFMGRGDALIRILPDPRPIPVKIDIST